VVVGGAVVAVGGDISCETTSCTGRPCITVLIDFMGSHLAPRAIWGWLRRDRWRTARERSRELHLVPSPGCPAGRSAGADKATAGRRGHHRDAGNLGCLARAMFVSAATALPVVVVVAPAVAVPTAIAPRGAGAAVPAVAVTSVPAVVAVAVRALCVVAVPAVVVIAARPAVVAPVPVGVPSARETFGSGQSASAPAVLCTSSSSRPVVRRCSKFRRRTSNLPGIRLWP
jgi:hypothetical protein